MRALRPDADFAVCSNPEFLREGSAIYDFTHPDRVLVGCDDDRAREVMERLYKPLALRNAPVMFVSRESAELAKYAANAFLAMKISFINEIADLCEAVDADVQEVATAIGADGRIGNKFLHPGPGYGGSCFPKDVAALIRTAREARSPLVADRAGADGEFGAEDRHGAGASSTPRGARSPARPSPCSASPSSRIPTMCARRQAWSSCRCCRRRARPFSAYDPHARSNAEALLPGVVWCDSALEAVEQADIAVVLTEWNEFRALDLDAVKAKMRGDVLVDFRNVYSPVQARAAGFNYTGVGRA